MPPFAETVAEPVLLPKHDTFVYPKIFAFKPAAGCVIVTETVVLQLFASLTVTEYVPAERLLAVAVYCAGTVFHV